MGKTLSGALILEYDSPEDTEKYAERYSCCPHIHFWGIDGNEAFVLLEIPEEKRFWAEYIGEHPEKTFGGNMARLSFLEKVFATPNPRVFEGRMQVSPCGSDCSRCPGYGRCPGCPATVHFRVSSPGGKPEQTHL